jgi:hypothetical protein
MLTLHFLPGVHVRRRTRARACVETLKARIRAEHPEVLDVSVQTEED